MRGRGGLAKDRWRTLVWATSLVIGAHVTVASPLLDVVKPPEQAQEDATVTRRYLTPSQATALQIGRHRLENDSGDSVPIETPQKID